MLEYRLKATLRAYVNGVFPTKVSDLENDVPFLETIEQKLTVEQQRQSIKNQNATEILAENFVRYDVSTKLTDEQQEIARENISALSTFSIDSDLHALDAKLQTNIDVEATKRIDADDEINRYLDPRESLQGLTASTVTTALNELAARISLPEVDCKTIVRKLRENEEKLQAIAIKDVVDDGTELKISPQDIKNIETRLANSETEIERLAVRGGYITPYNFGWSGGTVSSLAVGATFQEQNPVELTKKRIITVVSEGGDYPKGKNINVSDARVKALKFQTDITAWGVEDIWNESFSRYGDDAFPFILPKNNAITLQITKGINPRLPIGYWESIGTDVSGYEYGVWVSDSGEGHAMVNFGRFMLTDGEIIKGKIWLSFDAINELSTAVINYWHNKDDDSDISIHAIVTKKYEKVTDEELISSGIDWSESFLYWEGHSPIELYNGTRCINLFDGCVWEIANSQITNPTVFEWNLADIGAELGFAKYTTGGVVKVTPTVDDAQNKCTVYGVMLDENNRMFVDRLGLDMSLTASKADVAESEKARDNEIRELYDTLVGEGWIESIVAE